MDQIKEYYVVGIYESNEEVPRTVYKITTSIEEAVLTYCSYITNPKCYVGTYHDNRLIKCGQFRSINADGPGLFTPPNCKVTKDMLYDYMIN